MAEVICHRQALEPPTIGQAVADEVHAPHLVDRPGQLQWHTLAGRPLDLLALAYGEVRCAVKSVHPLVVDARELRAQQVVDSAIAEAAPSVRDLHDLAAELLGYLIRLGWMAVAVAGEPHKLMLGDQPADGRALGLWG